MDFDWKRGILGIAILIVLIIVLSSSLGTKDCASFDCFQQNMVKCSPASYINEESEASWGYEILGKRGDKCEIEVTLLGAKEGSLDLRQFEGNSMSCFYELGIIAYPEKDLNSCTGELKENLQAVIIENLYKYIIDNLGEIGEELGST